MLSYFDFYGFIKVELIGQQGFKSTIPYETVDATINVNRPFFYMNNLQYWMNVISKCPVA